MADNITAIINRFLTHRFPFARANFAPKKAPKDVEKPKGTPTEKSIRS